MGEVHPFIRRPRYPAAMTRGVQALDEKGDVGTDIPTTLGMDSVMSAALDGALHSLADDPQAIVALIEQAGLDDRQARAAIRTLCRHMREATR